MRWERGWLLLACSLLASPCLAQVSGPDRVGVGQLVVLESATESQWIAIEPVDLVYRQFEQGKAFAFSSGVKPGRAIVLCVSWETRRIDRHIVTIGPGPGPNPDPPKPDPPQPDPPGPTKLYLIVVEESLEAAAGRGALYSSLVLQEYLRSKGHRWRLFDDDTKDADGNTPKDAAPWLAKAGTQRPMLFLVTPNGQVRYQGALPDTADQILALLKQHGG